MTTSFKVFKRTPVEDPEIVYETLYVNDFSRLSNAVGYCEYAAEAAGKDSSNWDTDDELPPLMMRLGNLDEVHWGIDIVTEVRDFTQKQ